MLTFEQLSATFWANQVISDCLAEANGDVDAALAAAEHIVSTQPIPEDIALSVDIALAHSRRVGEKWQGKSGRWFTKKSNGRVVPTKAPGGTHPTKRWSKKRASTKKRVKKRTYTEAVKRALEQGRDVPITGDKGAPPANTAGKSLVRLVTRAKKVGTEATKKYKELLSKVHGKPEEKQATALYERIIRSLGKIIGKITDSIGLTTVDAAVSEARTLNPKLKRIGKDTLRTIFEYGLVRVPLITTSPAPEAPFKEERQSIAKLARNIARKFGKVFAKFKRLRPGILPTAIAKFIHRHRIKIGIALLAIATDNLVGFTPEIYDILKSVVTSDTAELLRAAAQSAIAFSTRKTVAVVKTVYERGGLGTFILAGAGAALLTKEIARAAYRHGPTIAGFIAGAIWKTAKAIYRNPGKSAGVAIGAATGAAIGAIPGALIGAGVIPGAIAGAAIGAGAGKKIAREGVTRKAGTAVGGLAGATIGTAVSGVTGGVIGAGVGALIGRRYGRDPARNFGRKLSQLEEYAFSLDESVSLAAHDIGDKWQGPSGRWFTRKQDGRVVPYSHAQDTDKSNHSSLKRSEGSSKSTDSNTDTSKHLGVKGVLANFARLLERLENLPLVRHTVRPVLRKCREYTERFVRAVKKRYGLKVAAAVLVSTEVFGWVAYLGLIYVHPSFTAIPGTYLLGALPGLAVAETCHQLGIIGDTEKEARAVAQSPEHRNTVKKLAKKLDSRLTGEAKQYQKRASKGNALSITASLSLGLEASDAALAHEHKVGDKWQGPSGGWFTKRSDNRVVPTKAPGPTSSKDKHNERAEQQSSGGKRDPDQPGTNQPGAAARVTDGKRTDSPSDGHSPAQASHNVRIVRARREFDTSAPAVNPRVVPESLAQHLNEHQREGVARAVAAIDQYGGFLLADGTGVGKTRQLLATAKIMATRGKKVLLVSPAGIIKPDWKSNEISGSVGKDGAAMGIPLQLNRGDTPLRSGEVAVATYESLAKVKDLIDGNTVILFDEAHGLKNATSIRSQYGTEAAQKAGGVLYATATPADRPLDIAYLFRTRLFGNKPFGEVRRELNPDAVGPESAYRATAELFDRLTASGLMLKREISLDGVDASFDHIELPASAHQALNAIAEGATSKDRAQVIMRQRFEQEKYKIPATVERVTKELAEGRQCVVFVAGVGSKTKDGVVAPGTASQLRAALAAAGIPPEQIGELHGSEGGGGKEEVSAFQSGTRKVLITTAQSGGTGHNLDDTTGNNPRTQIIMTAPFSAIDNAQIWGRTHRLTTRSQSRIRYLFANTDVDRWNANLIRNKVAALGAIVAGEAARQGIPDTQALSTEFKEEEHPRDEIGQFVSKEGGGSSAEIPGEIEHFVPIRHAPLELPTKEDVARWGKQNIEHSGAPITPAEKEALGYYSSIGHYSMNQHARGKVTIPEPWQEKFIKSKIRDLDSLLERRTLRTDVVAVRAAVNAQLLSRFRSMTPGDEYTDNGFMSTTIQKGKAKEFTEKALDLSLASTNSMYFNTNIPNGTRANVISRNNEGELLLARGTTLRLDGIDEPNDREHESPIIHVSVIGQRTPPI